MKINSGRFLFRDPGGVTFYDTWIAHDRPHAGSDQQGTTAIGRGGRKLPPGGRLAEHAGISFDEVSGDFDED